MSADPKVASLIDCLRYRPVATTAAQMREAADEIERVTGRCNAVIKRMHQCEAALRRVSNVLEQPEWYDGDNAVEDMLETLGEIVSPFTDNDPTPWCSGCGAMRP